MQQDLASIMFLQFATIFGNDWLVIPVDVPVGSICRLKLLTVTDSFGNETSIEPFAQAGGQSVGWRMFTLATSGSSEPASEMMFLPPSLGTSLEGKPIEEVVFMRDEMANLCVGRGKHCREPHWRKN